MISNVNQMFLDFMINHVNLDKNCVKAARLSRDNLITNINSFDAKDDFFKLLPRINFQFGSFSRKTKCRPLDDIDLMIGIHAMGASYNEFDVYDDVNIVASDIDVCQRECIDNGNCLNSIKVLNRFKKELEKLPEYQHSELKRNQEAIVLNLVSKEWSFDIVPCFITQNDSQGKSYYLIPNGKGKWKKTNPKIDAKRIENVVSCFGNNILDLIRLFKYWNKHAKIITMKGYLVECMLLDYFENNYVPKHNIKYEFFDLLLHVCKAILFPVYDPKKLQGDINDLSYVERNNIYIKIQHVSNKVNQALEAEYKEINNQKAINLWADIFGPEFIE